MNTECCITEEIKFHWTYTPKSFKSTRVVGTPAEVLRLLELDNAKKGIGDPEIALILPSTFHTLPIKNQDLAVGAEMMMYAGVADLDCNTKEMDSELLKVLIKSIINSGATLSELCAKCPAFADATEAVKLFCSRLVEMGFDVSSWFTGGKGYRVVWYDPVCYLKYLNKTDVEKIGTRMASGFMKKYLGDECHGKIQKLCDIDKVSYTPGTGLKTDLFKHQSTGLWPVLIDFCDEEISKNMKMKREECDEKLGIKIIQYWTRVVENIPNTLEKYNALPEANKKAGPLEVNLSRMKTTKPKKSTIGKDMSSEVIVGRYEVSMPQNVIDDLQNLMNAVQENGGRVKNVYTTNGKQYYRVDCVNSEGRRCILNSDEYHKNNNCYLKFLKGHVLLFCHANTCDGSKEIGKIPESFMKLTGINNCLLDNIQTYEIMKQDFELTNFKVLQPPMTVNLNKKGKYILSSLKSCKESYGHMQCKVMVKDEWEKKQFINLWLKDHTIRNYDEVVFEPHPLVCHESNFNLWVPFKIAKEPLIKTERNYWTEYCQYMRNLLGDEKVVNYLLARYAFRIANPAIRTHVILIICGVEGDGKNRLLAPIYNIMEGYTCMLSSGKQLYGNHSMYEFQKLFLSVNEADGVANFENSDVLKTRATEPTLYVNPKGVQMYEIDNLCDYDMTTNNRM